MSLADLRHKHCCKQWMMTKTHLWRSWGALQYGYIQLVGIQSWIVHSFLDRKQSVLCNMVRSVEGNSCSYQILITKLHQDHFLEGYIQMGWNLYWWTIILSGDGDTKFVAPTGSPVHTPSSFVKSCQELDGIPGGRESSIFHRDLCIHYFWIPLDSKPWMTTNQILSDY